MVSSKLEMYEYWKRTSKLEEPLGWTQLIHRIFSGTDDAAGEKEEMYVASESDLTCVCDKSWAGGRRGAQGPLLRIK